MTITKNNNPLAQKSASIYTVLAAFLLIAAVTFLCFAPDLNNGLLGWDDLGYIVLNEHIKSLDSDTIVWAFTDFYCNYWAPLMWISLAIDYAIWGLNPVGYHLTNNILHAMNAGMFFLVSLELLKRYFLTIKREGNIPAIPPVNQLIYCSLLSAFFFAIHPLRVESVVWAAERKDVLSLFFGLAAVLAYLKYTTAVSPGTIHYRPVPHFLRSPSYWFTVVLYVLSLLSKSMLVTLPLVLVVLDWFPLRRANRRDLRDVLLEKAPLLFFAGIASLFTMRSQAPTLMSLELMDLGSRILLAFKSIAAYLWLTIWPVMVSPFYVHPSKNITDIGPEYLLPILLFAGITAICTLLLRRKPVFMAVWLIFLMTLFPVLGITQTGPQAMAARFTYVPGMALSLLFATGFGAAHARLSGSRPAVRALLAGLAALMLFHCYFTIRDISFWKDDITLWTRVIDLQPHFTGMAYAQRSRAYEIQGEFHKALDDVNEALAIAIRKKYTALYEIYSQRARVLTRLGDLDAAIADYTTAIASATFSLRSQYYMERGLAYQEQGKTDRANEDFWMSKMPDNNAGPRPTL